MQKQVKTNIEVGGAILTEEAINFLNNLQGDNNYDITYYREKMANAVCFIGQNFDSFGGDDIEKAKQIIIDLSYIRDQLCNLRKP